ARPDRGEPLRLPRIAAVAGRRLLRRHHRRAESVADGPVAGVEGRAAAAARPDDGRLVRRDGHRQQPDGHRLLLEGVVALVVLRNSGRDGARNVAGPLPPAAAAQEGHARGLTFSHRGFDGDGTLTLYEAVARLTVQRYEFLIWDALFR